MSAPAEHELARVAGVHVKAGRDPSRPAGIWLVLLLGEVVLLGRRKRLGAGYRSGSVVLPSKRWVSPKDGNKVLEAPRDELWGMRELGLRRPTATDSCSASRVTRRNRTAPLLASLAERGRTGQRDWLQ